MNTIKKFAALMATLVAFSFVGTADYLRLVETPSETNVVVMRGNPQKGTDIAIPARKAASTRTGTLRQQGAMVQYPTNIPGMGSLEKLLAYRILVATEFSLNCYQVDANGDDIFIFRAGVRQKFPSYSVFETVLHDTMRQMVSEVVEYAVFDPTRPIQFFWTLTQAEEFGEFDYFLDTPFFGKLVSMPILNGSTYTLPDEEINSTVIQISRDLGWRFKMPVVDAKLVVRSLETGEVTRYKDTLINPTEVDIFVRGDGWYLEKQFSTNSVDKSILIQLTFEDGHKAAYDADGNEVFARLVVNPISSGALVTIVGFVHKEIYEVGTSHGGFSKWNWIEVPDPASSITFPVTTNSLQFFQLKQK